MIFAAKTTASALLALAVAFTFNLDAPKWSLLTVFIVAQPQSGMVVAKGFYRILGTVAGAAVALVLVSLFAQERVLFLGTLALWIGLCTFVARSARNFASYGFVLSGYTAAIVGITGALAPDNAFFVAQARVTEISLGIIAVATVSQLVVPLPLAATLRRAVAAARAAVGECATAALQGQDTTEQRNRVVAQAVAIATLRASAVFEDHDVRDRSDEFRRLATAMLGVADIAYLLSRSMEWLHGDEATRSDLGPALARSAEALERWHRSELGAPALQRNLTHAAAALPLARTYHAASAPDGDVVHRSAAVGRVREFFVAIADFAGAYEATLAPASGRRRSAPLYFVNDWFGDAVAGLRAGLALLAVGTFWILADWPSGPTATILAAVVAARLATMEQPLRSAIGGTAIIALATLPAFVIAEVLLPHAAGFAMFSLIVGPFLFFCAFLMGHKKTAGLGFLTVLYFASTASFQDRMAYDPVGFLNDSIAIALTMAVGALLFATIAPETPAAVQRRFVRVAQRIFRRIGGRARPIGLTEFETGMTEAMHQLRRDLHSDAMTVPASIEAGLALLGVGRELIRIRDDASAAVEVHDIAGRLVKFLDTGRMLTLKRAQHTAMEAALARLHDLRADELGPLAARAASRDMVAFAAIRDELERCSSLVSSETIEEQHHAA